MKLDNLLRVIVSICLILFFVIMIDGVIFATLERSEACEKIGMEYYGGGDFSYCLDEMKNAYPVIIDCENMFWARECEARFINVVK